MKDKRDGGRGRREREMEGEGGQGEGKILPVAEHFWISLMSFQANILQFRLEYPLYDPIQFVFPHFIFLFFQVFLTVMQIMWKFPTHNPWLRDLLVDGWTVEVFSLVHCQLFLIQMFLQVMMPNCPASCLLCPPQQLFPTTSSLSRHTPLFNFSRGTQTMWMDYFLWWEYPIRSVILLLSRYFHYAIYLLMVFSWFFYTTTSLRLVYNLSLITE